MTGRPTAEIIDDLRAFINWYGCDPGVPMSAVDTANEAADRLAELDPGCADHVPDFSSVGPPPYNPMEPNVGYGPGPEID